MLLEHIHLEHQTDIAWSWAEKTKEMTGQKEWFNFNNRQPPFVGKLSEFQVRVLGKDLYFSSVLGEERLFFAKIFLFITFKKRGEQEKKEIRLLTLDFPIIF